MNIVPPNVPNPRNSIIVPLDINIDVATKFVDMMSSAGVDYFKVGYNTLAQLDKAAIVMNHIYERKSSRIFLDGKFHDIPNTVANAVRESMLIGARFGYAIEMMNVHALGGRKMMSAAAKAATTTAEDLHIPRPKIIAVTILTSLSMTDIHEMGFYRQAQLHGDGLMSEMVLCLARLAQSSGMDGVVASAEHASKIKEQCGENFLVVSPGIRRDIDKKDDQQQIVTPRKAIENGSNILVVGRPIFEAKDPAEAFEYFCTEITAGQLARQVAKGK
jgi:orotidine-5'-phosphate decarboxylase